MALTTKRIIALPSQSEPQEGDYLAIDNAQGGTHKIPVGSVGVEVDDTFTEQGKAADAKAVGDALDEIRSQIEVTGTASGTIATFTDGAEMPAKSVIVNIEPQQSGTGTPSPDNVRTISGWESVNVYVSPTEDEADGHTTTVNLGRTVYGGTLDVVSGVLTVDRAMVTIDGTQSFLSQGSLTNTKHYSYDAPNMSNSPSTYSADVISDKMPTIADNSDTVHINHRNVSIHVWIPSDETPSAWFAENPTTVVYPLATPQTYQLTPTEIQTLLGENNVWADAGDVKVVYVRDLNIAINNLIGA